MPLVYVFIILCLIAVALWFVRYKLPADPWMKNVIYFVVIVAVLVWMLGLFGVLPYITAIKVGK